MATIIKNNEIHFADHIVVCDPDVADPEYMQEMAASLSDEGSMAGHMNELEDMNNDGSWTVKRHPTQAETPAH